MPPKRGKTTREGAGRKDAASPSAARDAEEVYDVASLPLDDAAGSSQQSAAPFSPSQKRAKRESPHSSAPGDALSTTTPQQQPALGETAETSLAEASLQALLDGTAPATVSDTILAVYRIGDTAQALCAVLNVLAKASGVAEVELDANALVDGVELRPLLEELYSRVPEDSEAYLLVHKDAKYRRFRRAFSEWCAALVRDGFAADVLLDATFLPVLSQWIIALSESKSRAFRHTATVALLAMVYALTAIAAELQTQLALLRTKKDITVVQRKRDDVVQWRDHLFSQSVHQRLRDVAPDIRLAGFQALHRWILEFPDEFMTNKYLRYLGMPLHDKRPELRAEALDTILQALAHASDAYSRMHLFLQYFAARLVELSNDVDVRCTELAIRVVAMMVRGDSDAPEGSELLTNEKIDQVLLTLFDERPTVRAAAGVLLKVFIHCRTVGEASEAEQLAVATELLCSFAATLRAQYHEAMPERYLIDALWTPERPPVLLTEYHPILAAAQSDKPLDAVVGLQLLAALLLRVQGRLSLGPLPKDDRRGGGNSVNNSAALSKKVSLKAREETDVLRHRLSEDTALTLCSILEVHRGSEDVLQAAALLCSALDMSALTSQRHHTALSALLIELRKATLLSSCTSAETCECLAQGWHQLAFTESPMRAEAHAHLQELRKNVLDHFTRFVVTKRQLGGGSCEHGEEEGEVLAVWGRMRLVSALVSMDEQAAAIQSALRAELTAPSATSNPTLALLVVGTAVNAFLWRMKACNENGEGTAEGAHEELRQYVQELVTAILQYEVAVEESAVSFSVVPDAARGLVPVTEIFVHLSDLLALPYYNMSQVQQETLVRLVRGLHESTSAALRGAQDYLKMHVQEHRARQQGSEAGQASTTDLQCLVAARRTCSRLEALQLRLVTGIARLFLFVRLDNGNGSALAAPFLVLWTQSPSKAVADTFKSLLHTLRDRAGGNGFALERDVVLAAYHHCAEVGATPVSVEALHQIGAKLASLHFVGSDRFYSCCPAMVQFGADFATSTDPMLLQAIVPYASKLRPVDALHVLRDQLSKSDIFTAESSNAYVRTFVSALRRAAKLDDSASSSSHLTGNATRRPRALGGAGELADEESMLADIAQGLPEGAASAAGAAGGGTRRAGGVRGQRISVASRVVTADGWHVPANSASQESDDVVEVAMSQEDAQRLSASAAYSPHRSIVNVPTSQEVGPSAIAEGLGSGEVFVATEEYE